MKADLVQFKQLLSLNKQNWQQWIKHLGVKRTNTFTQVI